MSRSENAIFTNMCMISDGNGNILVQDRRNPDWPGITFPGGHVEKGESFTDAVIREVFEETGLTIRCPVLCGIKQFPMEDGSRYIVLLYRADEFTGALRSSEEGRVFWMKPEELRASDRLSPNFEHYLPLFLDGGYSELFFDWDGASWDGVPQYFAYEI